MYGILGGLLELVNISGGIVLWCLIGEPAWRINKTARWARILIGSIPSGIILAIIATLLIQGLISESFVETNVIATFVIASLCGIVAVALLATFLEVLRKSIEEDRTDS